MVYKASPSFGLFYFLFLIIGVYLLYNAVLVSTVQQNESAIHMHISPPFGLPSHSGHHSALSRLPCAREYVLINSLNKLYIVSIVYMCQSPSTASSHLPFPLWCLYICSLHLCLYFCFVNKTIYIIFLDSPYMC